MSKSNSFETSFLQHIFNNTAITGIGDAGGVLGSSVAGSLYIGLHTSDPGEAGSQTTNEAAYTNYARVAVARTAGGWSVLGNTVSNVGAITFPQSGATGANVTHFSVGTDLSGAGSLLFSGALTASLNITDGVTPEFGAGSLTVTED